MRVPPAALRAGGADLVSFGKLFLANPYLPARFARHAPALAYAPRRYRETEGIEFSMSLAIILKPGEGRSVTIGTKTRCTRPRARTLKAISGFSSTR